MRNLIILLVCVPLQFVLVSYRAPAEKYLLNTIQYLRNGINAYIKAWTEEIHPEETTFDGEDEDNEITIKMHRPSELKYKVGHVVVNTKLAYLAIIIGWSVKEGNEPVYEIITDHPAAGPDYKSKVRQSDLLRLENIEVHHSEEQKYFEMFDEEKSKFVPKPWLRLIYPYD